jgi:transposase
MMLELHQGTNLKNSSDDYTLPSQLDSRQLQAAVMLASGRPAKEVAEKLGVAPQTISAWRASPEFDQALTHLKLQYLKSARDGLRWLAAEAVDEIARLMRHGKSERIRLQAALAVLRGIGAIDHDYTKNVLWRHLGSL